MKLVLILGDQLFSLDHYQELMKHEFFMAEDLELCTHFKYHQLKITLFLSAMRDFRDALLKKGVSLDYHELNSTKPALRFEQKLLQTVSKKNITTLVSFEINDSFFEKRIQMFCKEHRLEWQILKTPAFLTDRSDLALQMGTKSKPFMKTFYQWQRKRLNLLMTTDQKPEGGQFSFDAENRKPLPKNIEPPALPQTKPSKHVTEVSTLVRRLFKDHPGAAQNTIDLWVPTTHASAKSWLSTFLEERFHLFGLYEDAITQRSDTVFHSCISPLLNMGLLTPAEVVEATLKAYKKSKAPLASTEGFLRQIIGWREFIFAIDRHFGERQMNSNFFEHHARLTPAWYNGTTGIEILDRTIQKVDRMAYAHHIERLMILSNLMLLCRVHPHDVYRWFMELFIDSSDWVMGPNVFGMGQFSDGGIFATKPYICGSNYLLKMSDYKKGDWCDVVDGLYWSFIDEHKTFYAKNPRMSMMAKTVEKMAPARKKKIYAAAKSFRQSVTTQV